MSHIFLSYCAEDRERVRPLVALLSEVAPVWWDQSIHHGENWEIAVETAVEQAACVVVAWTRESVKSNWVRSEAGDARDRSIQVPVLLDDVKPPLAFRHIQTAQLQGWDGDREHPQAQALKAALASLVARRAASPPGAPASSPLTVVAPPQTAAAQLPGEARSRPAAWLQPPNVWKVTAAIAALLLGTLVLGGYLMLRPSADDGSSHEVVPTPRPLASPTPLVAVVSPTLPGSPTAVPSPTPTRSPKIIPSPIDTPSPTLPTPTPTPTPELPAQILVKEIATFTALGEAVSKQFHYTIDS